MTETISSGQIAKETETGQDQRLRLVWATGAILVALTLAVVLLRLQRLSELPPRLYNDEGAHGVDALHVLQGEHAVYFTENNGREGLIVYAVALTTSLLGTTVLAVRLPTALASAGTVFVVFWLGWLLYGRDDDSQRDTPWRGLLVGGAGAGLLAVSFGLTVIGRTAYRANFLPLLLSLCIALLWWGWRQRVWWRVALAGLCAGLLPYTYIAARFAPLLFLFFGLSLLFPWRRRKSATEDGELGTVAYHSTRLLSRIRHELPWVGLFVGVAALVAAPILVYFALHPEDFLYRSGQISVFRRGTSQGDPLGALLDNVWGHLLIFGFSGDPNPRQNLPGQPLLNALEAFFFWLGAGISLWHWRRPQNRLMLSWLVVMLLPAMLSRDHNFPNSLRLIGAVPAIYLLIGVGVWGTVRFRPLSRLIRATVTLLRLNRLKNPASPTAGNSYIWVNDAASAPVALGLVVGGLILVQGVLTYRTYFVKWADVATGIEQLYSTQWQELSQVVNARTAPAESAYLIPSYTWHHSFEYLDQNAAPAHVVYLGRPNLSEEIVSTLSAMENVSAVNLVDWHDDSGANWSHYETERLTVLLGKYGRYLGSDEYPAFRMHTYADVDLARPWAFFDDLEPLSVHYDRGIGLHGFALAQGEEQLASQQQQFYLKQSHSLWLALRWSTAPGLEIDYSISLRLHDAEGKRVYQGDHVLFRSTDHAPTGGWTAEEEVDTLHLVELPVELLPGDYELRLVVYDFESLQPTVELGVWEPEKTIARLHLGEAN
ncbi:MAG: hypothetical protein OXJ55_21480 [Caldilineaceae bacterium]|nr:hypothetical protein [Caldilineaceae bacterium]